MTLTKQHKIIIGVVIALIILYFVFFRKKKTAESGYAKPGDRWDYRSKHGSSNYDGNIKMRTRSTQQGCEGACEMAYTHNMKSCDVLYPGDKFIAQRAECKAKAGIERNKCLSSCKG